MARGKEKRFSLYSPHGSTTTWLEEIDNAQCSRPQFDLDFDKCSSCITATSQNQDVDTESVVTSATSDFNFDDDDSLTKLLGSIMETEQR